MIKGEITYRIDVDASREGATGGGVGVQSVYKVCGSDLDTFKEKLSVLKVMIESLELDRTARVALAASIITDSWPATGRVWGDDASVTAVAVAVMRTVDLLSGGEHDESGRKRN